VNLGDPKSTKISQSSPESNHIHDPSWVMSNQYQKFINIRLQLSELYLTQTDTTKT